MTALFPVVRPTGVFTTLQTDPPEKQFSLNCPTRERWSLRQPRREGRGKKEEGKAETGRSTVLPERVELVAARLAS